MVNLSNIPTTEDRRPSAPRKASPKTTFRDLWCIKVNDAEYRVESQSGSELFPYREVNYYGNGHWLCTCPGYSFHADCSHVKRVMLAIIEAKKVATEQPAPAELEPLVYPPVGNQVFVPRFTEADMSTNKLVALFQG